ncbi:unnamed protein product, partial [Callosobruchus maculatus]
YRSPCSNSDYDTFYNIVQQTLDKIENAYPKANIALCVEFKMHLGNDHWNEVYQAIEAENKAKAFFETFLFYYESCFPISNKKLVPNQKTKPLSTEVENLKQLTIFCHSNYKNKPTPENKEMYNQCK